MDRVKADRRKAAPAELTPEDLLARPSVPMRLALVGLVAVVALPVLPAGAIVGWCALYLAVIFGEETLIRRRGFLGGDWISGLISLSLSSLIAIAAAVLIRFGDPSSKLFAVALMSFSSVNVLLRYYNAPKLFFAGLMPHALVLGWVGFSLTAAYLSHGQWVRAAAPFAVLAVYGLLFLPTQTRLAATWRRLKAAKLAAEQASQAKSDFLATMSHEIRTPLNGVLGMAQAMERADLPASQREQLMVIRRSGETLLSILNDVLDISKIEEGALRLEPGEFDMEHVTRGAVATFGQLAEQKGLTFEFSIAEEAKGGFTGDSVRLRQILYNLVSNAVKFTEQGGVGVCVSYASGRLKLEVADSGIGIAKGRTEQLFEKFVQGDTSATRRYGGTGLGLAICKRLAELMDGRIDVSSVEGKGSIFTVALPLERTSKPAVLEMQAPDAPEPDSGPIRVLAAEDNQVNQLVLKTLLSQAGLEPTLVENGREAVEAWRSGPWDVILMDIQMPVMDGLEAAREIRAAEAAGDRPRTPIIAVTANAMTHQMRDYLSVGMDTVVPKPLDAARLFEAIEQALTGAPAGEVVAAA